jgi:hypothetical protein
MSYNASYDPYFADIAAPATVETMTIICMLATIYFLWTNQNAWFFFFALMSYLCRPTGLLILGLLMLAIAICLPYYRRRWLTRISLALGMCILVAIAYEKIYMLSIIGDSVLGYDSGSVFRRLQFLRVDDISRINYVMFPCGILPLISLFAFRWQDSLSRMITFVSISYFLFFYFQAFVALHHFVPVMILPLVVFWRVYLHQQRLSRRSILTAVALMGFLAFWLSFPRHFEINRSVRAIGQKTSFRIGDYVTNYREQVRHEEILSKFISPDWEVKNPTEELVSSNCSIIYYSTRPKHPGTPINYIVQPLGNKTPPGFIKVADDEVAAFYVKDLEEWHRDRFRHQRTDYRSLLYDIPRITLFQHWGAPKGNYSIDLRRFRIIDDFWWILSNRSRTTKKV